jgi:hypothetical protein
MDQQMNLDMGPTLRKRVALLGALEDTQPAPRKRAVLVEDEPTQYSPWVSCSTNPPVKGEWDVRAVERPHIINRYFFDAGRGYWLIEGWPFGTVIEGTHEWRGLAYDPKGFASEIDWTAPL